MKRDVSQRREILELIAARAHEGRTTSFRTLARELDLSEESACEYLKRLWRERLINSSDRPPRFAFRLGPGESLRELRFRIHKRGLARLQWWKDEDEGLW
jgi:DNA-binding IclR family transcriptional regulator